MNPMNLLNKLRQWLAESRRNQLLAAGAAFIAVATLFAVGVVVAVSGDSDRQEQVSARTASPSPVAEEPTRSPRRTATASLTPEPVPVETLAFLRDGDIWLINADGSGERRLTELGNVEEFSWISSTELDAVTGEDRSGHLLLDVNGNARELTIPPGGSWSPDGSLYAVPTEEEVLVVFNRDGSEVTRLEPGPSPDQCAEPPASQGPYRLDFGRPSFALGGRELLIAVHCWAMSGAYNFYGSIYRVSLDGALNERLPEPGDSPQLNLRGLIGPLFSPDGRRIAWAYTDGFSLCPWGRGLTVADADGANGQRLAPASVPTLYSQTPLPETFGGISELDWSPRSDAIVAAYQVYFCGPDADPSAEAAVAGLYILKPDGDGEEQLVEGEVHSPSWSPSGRFVAYVTGRYFGEPTQPPAIRLLDLTTGQSTDLTQGSQPAWRTQR